jgi:Tfp pilus assembly protein PilN
MEPKVKELDNMQQQIKKFRPWFDGSFRSLSILRKLAESFPEEGVVTAKTLEIRELSSITCSGTARDNQAFLRMLDQLRAAKEVTDVKVDQVRGTAPMQFTFNFHWGERANEN